jgi:hypothetical protein
MKNKTEVALELFDFIKTYCNESAAKFEAKYPEYDLWMAANNGSDTFDYINETYISKIKD